MVLDKFYKQALLIRRTEDTFLELFSQGKMNGTVHTCNGQEFSAIAFSNALKQGDFVYSNHRCHGHYIAHTNDVEGLISELMGKNSGTCGGIGSSQHLCNEDFYSNGIQGGILPVAAGMACANKFKKNDQIGLVFIGDGTLGQGVVYETFNLVSLLGLPLLIVCEDNGYAQSTSQKNNLAGNILARAEAFGIKTFHSNTWDIEKLFDNAKESIEYVREDCKPAFHLVNTYRLNHHSKSDDNRCENEVNDFVKKDPLNIYKNNHKASFEKMLLSVDSRISKIVESSDREKEQAPSDYVKDTAEAENYHNFIPLEMLAERVVNRINYFFDVTINQDKSVIFLGEDVLSPYGGAFKVAKNLSEKYPENVISTPISEQAITGLSNGLALSGFKPYLEIMFGDFITLSMDQIINHASKFHHMYNKKVECPIVIRTPMGGGRGYGPTHSQTLDKILAGIDNVKLIALNSFVDPYIIYKEIYNNEKHPVIVVENKIDYGKVVGEKELQNYSLVRSSEGYPLVKCSPISIEPTLTIVSYGGIASEVFEVLIDVFVETELLPELIVLSKICPLDLHAVCESVEKTRNIIVVEEGSLEFGIGAEIISSVLEMIGTNNIDMVHRIGALPVPIPSSRTLEEYVLPNKSILEKIVRKVNI